MGREYLPSRHFHCGHVASFHRSNGVKDSITLTSEDDEGVQKSPLKTQRYVGSPLPFEGEGEPGSLKISKGSEE